MKRTVCLALVLGSFAAHGFAQNSVHTGARVIIPDGTMLTDLASSISNSGERWYATVVEGGHSYAVEVFNATDGLMTNNTNLQLYENDGTTLFLAGNSGACNVNNQASPSLEGSNNGTDGKRCLIYPALSAAAPSRVMKIRIFDSGGGSVCQNCLTRIRVRDTTIFSRWSVNGYNMYLAVHNPSIVPVAGFALYYPDSPTSPADFIYEAAFYLGGLHSFQFVLNSLSLTPNHGSMHILTFADASAPGSAGVDVTVQTYAYSTTAGTFNLFIPERLNHGGANSIGYNN